MQKPITIFCAFTRRWAVERWLDNLMHVPHNPELTNLCFIVDIDDPWIVKALTTFAQKHNYRNLQIKLNDDWHPNEVRLSVRRMRIADVHNQSKELIARTDGEYIIGLEDDTVFDRLESFDQLIGPIYRNDSIGFVQGVQMGRWGANMIGAWIADDFITPSRIETLLPPSTDNQTSQEITGGGWYGYATQRQLYLDCDYYTATSQPWGPDVNFGLWLRQRGYKCLIDWSIIFGHNDHNIIGYPDKPPRGGLIKVVYTKDKLTTKWKREDYGPTAY